MLKMGNFLQTIFSVTFVALVLIVLMGNVVVYANSNDLLISAAALAARMDTAYDIDYDKDYNYYEANGSSFIPVSSDSEFPIAFITTARLNLRPSPSTAGERIALLPAGQRVYVTDFRDGEWFAVEHNGTRGYMFGRYLRELLPPGQAGTVELLHWDVARYIMTVGTPATIIDVRTGLTFQLASFSNGRHADVETLTAEDTATMLQAFGGRWTWQPRPVIVVVNGRTIAASLSGMPHAQQTRTDNNLNGHVCLHFLGSRTHNGNRSHENDHQNAVHEAFRVASNW